MKGISIVGAIRNGTAFKNCTPVPIVYSSVNSRLQVRGRGNTYLGDKFDAFFNVFCILGVFLGEFEILGDNPTPKEIAGNNTGIQTRQGESRRGEGRIRIDGGWVGTVFDPPQPSNPNF